MHNTFLMERLAEHLDGMTVIASPEIGLDPDAKEAMCFAWLGWRTLHRLPGNAPSVTGARVQWSLAALPNRKPPAERTFSRNFVFCSCPPRPSAACDAYQSNRTME